MENHPHHATEKGHGRKSEAIHRWLQEVIDHKAPNNPPPFDGQGKPLYRDHVESHRPQFFTFAELELERQRQGDGSPDAGDSPILASKLTRRGTIKKPQQPSGKSFSREDSGREVFVRTSSTGKQIMATNEREIYLQEGEKIDPSGISIQSICPRSGGRTRALSRSDAIKRPSSPFPGTQERSRKMVSFACEDERPRTARTEKSSQACSKAAPQGLSRSKSQTAHLGQKSKASKFVECL